MLEVSPNGKKQGAICAWACLHSSKCQVVNVRTGQRDVRRQKDGRGPSSSTGGMGMGCGTLGLQAGYHQLGAARASHSFFSSFGFVFLLFFVFFFVLTCSACDSSLLLQHFFQELVKLSGEICAVLHAESFN